jgi:hypothetical protein
MNKEKQANTMAEAALGELDLMVGLLILVNLMFKALMTS